MTVTTQWGTSDRKTTTSAGTKKRRPGPAPAEPVVPLPLTVYDMAAVVARYLAPWEVLAIARAAGRATDLRAVRAQFVSGYWGAAGGGSIYNTRSDGIHVELTATRGAGRVARAGVITWPALFAHVVDRLTSQRVAALAAAVTADAEYRVAFVACPGPYPDTATWHREYGAEYYRTAHALSTATTAAAAAILTADHHAQLDLLDLLTVPEATRSAAARRRASRAITKQAGALA